MVPERLGTDKSLSSLEMNGRMMWSTVKLRKKPLEISLKSYVNTNFEEICNIKSKKVKIIN